jgi:hypothetical protein
MGKPECLFPRKWNTLGLPEGIMLPSIAVREHNAAVLRFEEVCDAYRELELELCAVREELEELRAAIAKAEGGTAKENNDDATVDPGDATD